MNINLVNKTTAIVAKRGSGKSVLLKWRVQAGSKFGKIYMYVQW